MVKIDAHNHLQDPDLDSVRAGMFGDLRSRGIGRWGVNGTRESDWAAVVDLAEKHSEVYPSIGLHPWYVRERSGAWEDRFLASLDRWPCGVGEVGLDNWIRDADLDDQERVLRRQLELAPGRPLTIHCLKAWGRLLEVLRDAPLPPPEQGFLLHSYGGSTEMIAKFLDLGARFSFSGYFIHERKLDVRERFRDHIPLNRLLLETDAPAMALPPERDGYELGEVNHPGNLSVVYEAVAELYGIAMERLETTLHENFETVFPAKCSS